MSLSKELVKEFQAIYVKKYCEVIEYNKAESQLKELAELVRLTAQAKRVNEYTKAI